MKLLKTLPFLSLLLVLFAGGCNKDDDATPDPDTTDTAKPTVTLADPLNSATGVVVTKSIAITFSEALDPTTISASTFTLKQGTTSVAGTVDYTGNIATFKPTADLSFSTIYTFTITTGVKDIAGNALATNHVGSFTTAAVSTTPDTTAPTIVSNDPLNDATNVARNKVISIVFSEAMDASTINSSSFTIKQGATVIPGVVAYSGST
ncbi:MAG TPA: Ig-like domain-containing protein, partial [Cyclobacteriaceae bacterium]